MFDEFIVGLANFGLYFGSGLVAIVVFVLIYTTITPHNEITQIKEKNPAAALAFTGSLLGFGLAITSLIENSVSLPDFYMWAGVAIVVQLLVYLIVRLVFPRISHRVADGEVPAALLLAGASVVAGMLNAASMSY